MKLSLFYLELAAYGAAVLAGFWVFFRLLGWVVDGVNGALKALADKLKEPGPPQRLTASILLVEGDGPPDGHPDAVPVEQFMADLKARCGAGVDTAPIAAQAARCRAENPGCKVYVHNVRITAA